MTKTGSSALEAYCVHCRAKRKMVNPRSISMKNGRPAVQGNCPVCNTKISRIGKV
ncbi:DUF5679 domain-containing protein [Chloroflexota bacterium]